MDDSESLAREHLKYRGFQDIIYEPDGNRPDFLVDHRIAVEVRRLNQKFMPATAQAAKS